MCGIAGKIAEDPFGMDQVFSMVEKLQHRGPDDSGFYCSDMKGQQFSYGNMCMPDELHSVRIALAHQRLSVVDLTENGHQPIPNEDFSMWLVANGEIYNAQELRADLERCGHNFRSRTDTEVVLHGYEEWGQDVVHRLNGMFAFAIYDGIRKNLFCARDPFGIKPFYYVQDESSFAFASEIKALLCLPEVLVCPDEEVVNHYLNYSFPVTDRTWFKGVRQLPPGTAMTVHENRVNICGYFQCQRASGGSVVNAADLHELLERAVVSHLQSDVDVGFHLSGGLDSSGIVALAGARLGRIPVTFSGRFREGKNYDERAFIEEVRKHCRTQHHEVCPSVEEFLQAYPAILYHLDEPVAGPGSFPQYCLNQRINAENIKVVCGGQGADELFGGYPWYLPSMASACEEQRNHRLHALDQLFDMFEYDETREKHLAGFECRAEGNMHWDVCYYLPALLQVEDRTSMAWSVESRIPYLEMHLAQVALSISAEEKIAGGITKTLLRDALNEVLPKKVVWRKDKMGFPTPIDVWLRGPLWDWASDILFSERTQERGMINGAVAKALLERHRSGENFVMPLWQAINIELWHRIFVDGDGIEKSSHHN